VRRRQRVRFALPPPARRSLCRQRAHREVSCLSAAATCLVVLSIWGRHVRADELSNIEKAYGAYVGHNYAEAESRLRALLDAKGGGLKDPETVADARMYLGAVLLAEGRKEQAAELLEELLLDKPDYQPDPLRVPLAALDAIVDARLRLRDKLGAIQAEKVRRALDEKAKAEAEKRRAIVHLAMLERYASEEIVVERHSRWEALVPFGVGQFQNRQSVLGWSFLTGETLLAAGSAIGLGLALYNESLAYDAQQGRTGTASQYEGRANEAAAIGNILAAGFAALAIGGIVHAEVAFVPEHVHVEERRRPIPSLSLAPIVGLGELGVAGKF
jgi:hypothetical protein